jgi:ABC-type phosphonate transport system ATPase subunit
MNNVKPVLEAKGLTKHYGQVIAMDGADFELYPGEILKPYLVPSFQTVDRFF